MELFFLIFFKSICWSMLFNRNNFYFYSLNDFLIVFPFDFEIIVLHTGRDACNYSMIVFRQKKKNRLGLLTWPGKEITDSPWLNSRCFLPLTLSNLNETRSILKGINSNAIPLSNPFWNRWTILISCFSTVSRLIVTTLKNNFNR